MFVILNSRIICLRKSGVYFFSATVQIIIVQQIGYLFPNPYLAQLQPTAKLRLSFSLIQALSSWLYTLCQKKNNKIFKELSPVILPLLYFTNS